MVNGLFRFVAVTLVPMILSACVFTPPAVSSQPNAAAAEVAGTVDCHPAPDAVQPQYVIGYGSLMQDESRKRTSPLAGPAHPVEVAGYRRGWIARGSAVGFSTTYLGIVADPKASVNAVIYRVDANELAATDRREASYCRTHVRLPDIRTLEPAGFQVEPGQAWIYVNRPELVAAPSARYPIVQSYVDVFLSGCLEQEQRFNLTGFARQCVATTQGWSENWINDRIYPRRPFVFQPKAAAIDALLAQQLPAYFARIRIESAY
jgi:hypothetical protein